MYLMVKRKKQIWNVKIATLKPMIYKSNTKEK